MNASPESPIEPYLDDLLGYLRGTPREVRRALGESEAHLRDSANRFVSAGFSEEQAARRAIEQFGDARTIASGFNRALSSARRQALVLSLLRPLWTLVGVGFTAIGISGAVAWIAMQATSAGAVFADPPNTHYSAGACSYWLQLHPSAPTCATAALLEGRDDALFQRFALGVLGVIMLLTSVMWKRRRQPAFDLSVPTALIAVVVFGVAGAYLTGYGIDRAVQNTGAGQWLASGGVALTVAIGYIVTLWRASPPWSEAITVLGRRQAQH